MDNELEQLKEKHKAVKVKENFSVIHEGWRQTTDDKEHARITLEKCIEELKPWLYVFAVANRVSELKKQLKQLK